MAESIRSIPRESIEETPAGRFKRNKSFILSTLMDVAWLLIIGGASLGIYYAENPLQQIFLVEPAFEHNIAWPLRPLTLAILPCTAMAIGVPIMGIILSQIITSDLDALNLHNALMGLASAAVLASFFQVLLKCLVGGLRPHFLAVCEPDLSRPTVADVSIGMQTIHFANKSICTGDKKLIKQALQSWPSGHSSNLFAGFTYFSIFLNGCLRPFRCTQTSIWRVFIVLMPLEIATFSCGFLFLDKFHGSGDISAGAVIGIVCALTCYRQRFKWNGTALSWFDKESEGALRQDNEVSGDKHA